MKKLLPYQTISDGYSTKVISASYLVHLLELMQYEISHEEIAYHLLSPIIGSSLHVLEDKANFNRLVTIMNDKNAPLFSRLGAISSLSEKGKRAIEPLIRCLNDESPEIRENVVKALCEASLLPPRLFITDREVGDRKAVPALIKLLHDEAKSVRLSVIETLGQIPDDRSVEPLINSLLTLPFTGASRQNTTISSSSIFT